MRDVTEARRREAVRETFIGVLSHELRTPVTTIFGGAKLLARPTSTLDEETTRGIFRDIHDEAERLQRLVEDVVALNRFGDESGEVGAEPVLLQRLIPRVVELGGRPLARGHVRDRPRAGAADGHRRPDLHRAGRAQPAVQRREIRRRRVDRDDRRANAGEGRGRRPRPRRRTRASRPRRRTGCSSCSTARPARPVTASGAGIGLFVCARLIAAMGGRIWAAPREEGGAEFGFALTELEE